MKQKTITTDKATLLVVEISEGARDVIVTTFNRIGFYLPNGIISYEMLPEGNWQLLGSIPDITEEQAHSIVDKEFNEMTDEWFYRNYSQDYDYNYTVGESLYSLLQANEVYFENPIPPFIERLEDFKEAQSKVWDKERTYLFKKI